MDLPNYVQAFELEGRIWFLHNLQRGTWTSCFASEGAIAFQENKWCADLHLEAKTTTTTICMWDKTNKQGAEQHLEAFWLHNNVWETSRHRPWVPAGSLCVTVLLCSVTFPLHTSTTFFPRLWNIIVITLCTTIQSAPAMSSYWSGHMYRRRLHLKWVKTFKDVPGIAAFSEACFVNGSAACYTPQVTPRI